MKINVKNVDSIHLYDYNENAGRRNTTVNVVKVDDVLTAIEEESKKGNDELGGFSAGRFISELRKKLEQYNK